MNQLVRRDILTTIAVSRKREEEVKNFIGFNDKI